MKLWSGFGSEHSANLVMIGRFQEAKDAEQVMQIIDKLTQQVMDEVDIPRYDTEPRNQKYSKPMLDLLIASKINTVGPTELRQLVYDVSCKVEDNAIVITTDEVDVSVFMKIMIERGARIEIYSAHDYPDTGHGRGN